MALSRWIAPHAAITAAQTEIAPTDPTEAEAEAQPAPVPLAA